MPADYHTHTPLCHHASGEPEDYVEAAIIAGLDEYGVSDHAPQAPEPFDDWRMAERDLPAYLDWIERARRHAGDRLVVRSGLECDWLSGNEAHLEQLAARHDWDYLIGSLHYLPTPALPKWDFDNPIHLSQWKSFSPSEIDDLWALYWRTYEAMVRSRLFDIHGHPDLIKKFAVTPAGDLRRYYDPVIEALADAGGTIEINTAGWHKPCAEQYPARPFLEMAAEAGIGLSINSDAHAPGEVARDFPRAYSLAREVGFQALTRFEKRSPRPGDSLA